MKPDLYTKAILTVIAALLALNLIANLRVPSVFAQGGRLMMEPARDHTAGNVVGTYSDLDHYWVLFWNR
jgi:hypothetical protein